MTNCTRIIGVSAAMILTAYAAADFDYEQAILTAESNCFTGTHQEIVQQSLGANGSLEANSSCGGGMTSAYLEAGEDYFVLSAGSTVHGSSSSGSEKEAPVIVDGGNGYGAVEIEFTIDRPTLFTMSRSIEGSKVSFWDGQDLLDSLDYSDDKTALRAGTYWVSIETDEYGKPVWAEVDIWQDKKDPADLNDDGKVDQKDLKELVSLMSKKSSYPTGGDCTDGAKDNGKASLDIKGKPIKGKPLPRPKPGSFGSVKDMGNSYGVVMGYLASTESEKAKADFSDNKVQLENTDKARKDVRHLEIEEMKKPALKGDLNGDLKVDMNDIFFLLKRL